MTRTLLCAAGLIAVASATQAQDQQLTVYTYDSFITDWGPGPAIEAAFEAECGCDLVFSGHGDGAALLSRLRLEGARSEADVVLGLDTNLTAAAAGTLRDLFVELDPAQWACHRRPQVDEDPDCAGVASHGECDFQGVVRGGILALPVV